MQVELRENVFSLNALCPIYRTEEEQKVEQSKNKDRTNNKRKCYSELQITFARRVAKYVGNLETMFCITEVHCQLRYANILPKKYTHRFKTSELCYVSLL